MKQNSSKSASNMEQTPLYKMGDTVLIVADYYTGHRAVIITQPRRVHKFWFYDVILMSEREPKLPLTFLEKELVLDCSRKTPP